jgi:hypothetical protein
MGHYNNQSVASEAFGSNSKSNTYSIIMYILHIIYKRFNYGCFEH